MLSVSKYSVLHCFLNNSRTQSARDLRFSPIDRKLEETQVYEQTKNWSYFETTAVSKSLKDSIIKWWYLNSFLIFIWWINRLELLLSVYASPNLTAIVVQEIFHFYWSYYAGQAIFSVGFGFGFCRNPTKSAIIRSNFVRIQSDPTGSRQQSDRWDK